MHPTKFEGINCNLSKPIDMTDEQCYGLPAEKGIDPLGFPYFVTAWTPNHEDMKAINEGRPVFLKVLGHSHPPVALYTTDNNGEPNI